MIDTARFAPWVSAEAKDLFGEMSRAAGPTDTDINALRLHYDAFNQRHLEVALCHYPVDVTRDEIGGVRVDIVTRRGGAATQPTLISLHGGAFMWGRGAGALLEAVPVAATLGVRVIAVEYPLAPEHCFPAAVDEIASVYNALCATVPPEKLGIYGCSAGGVLTAQTVARLILNGAPTPGAIAMLCGTGLEMAGDSAIMSAVLSGREQPADPPMLSALPYFSGADVDDPLVLPGNHPDVLAQFPPSLLVTASRDFAAGSVATMHRRLLSSGAQADLLYFDGLWHAFHMATTLPEARETFAAMKTFFARHLT